MNRSKFIINRLPAFYRNDKRLGAIIDAISEELGLTDKDIDRVHGMIGIDTTIGTDIDRRWGKLFNIKRRLGEDDASYRNRIKISIPRLAGGTEHAIRYAIAVAMGIDNNSVEINGRIDVLDAWLYNGQFHEEMDKSFGCNVCIIKFNMKRFHEFDNVIDDIVKNVNTTKASGVKPQFVILITYDSLRDLTYNQLRDQGITYNMLSAKVVK